ncbi:MAG: glycosyltransferase family 4 protein [Paracoccaceae bacterium]|nr:glycosyltransferase family 4 protein [Paracoccaceae bacterium]
MIRAVRTLLPMAADGVGPSYTCTQLVSAAHESGTEIDVFVNRTRIQNPPDYVHTALPRALSFLPYKPISKFLTRISETNFVDHFSDGEVSYFWPSVSLEMHAWAAKNGHPVVMEAINTTMKSAKALLDEAYDSLGLSPGHGITNERVLEEEEKLATANAVFAPSRNVEMALAQGGHQDKVIPVSYGVDLQIAAQSGEVKNQNGNVIFLFCGFGCVRKGLHTLLEAWRDMPRNAKLQIVGNVEPAIREKFSDQLDDDRIQITGFTRDVARYYAGADVFVLPSLEEGDPLVTYEAAAFSLPIIATPAGGGRMGSETDGIMIVDKDSKDSLLNAMLSFHASEELRVHRGLVARKAVAGYDWKAVGAHRMKLLESVLA